jgi:nitrogen regulatory protein P-II 1
MQRIEAIIRPEKILDVKAALERLGYGGMTVTEVKGHGTQHGIKEEWNGQEFWVEFLPKLWFLIVVEDEDAEEVVEAICGAAATGEAGDGKVFISDVRDAVRVRTRERGAAALKGGKSVVAP